MVPVIPCRCTEPGLHREIGRIRVVAVRGDVLDDAGPGWQCGSGCCSQAAWSLVQHDSGGAPPPCFGYLSVRAPLYLTEQIAIIGGFMEFAFLCTAILFVANIAVQLRRMHNKELVLAANFPEYAAYRRNTARVIPGIY
jgi:protein-S-isoprenylcysteine O-methyltransferase Ste14